MSTTVDPPVSGSVTTKKVTTNPAERKYSGGNTATFYYSVPVSNKLQIKFPVGLNPVELAFKLSRDAEERKQEKSLIVKMQEALQELDTPIARLLYLATVVEEEGDPLDLMVAFSSVVEYSLQPYTPVTKLDIAASLLRRTIIIQGTRLFSHLRHDNELDQFTPLLWLLFNGMTDWGVVLQTYRLMPTAVLEDLMFDYHWHEDYGYSRTRPLNEVLPAIQERSDQYGDFPTDLLESLFGNQENPTA